MNNHLKTDKIVSIECGDNHSLFLSDSGKAFMCGCNDDHQIGNESESSDDSVSATIPFCVQSMKEYADIVFESGDCGYNHTMLISKFPTNDLYGCGGNSSNQLGFSNGQYKTK